MADKIKNFTRTVSLLILVANKFRSTTEEVGIGKLRRIIGLLRRNIGLIRIVVETPQYPIKMPSDSVRNETCFVLGNGPSLYTDLQDKHVISHMGDVVCVSRFVETALYEKIQPKYYVFADPAFWEAGATSKAVALRNNVYGQILRKTSWPLTIFVPFAGKDLFESIFSSSQNISLSFYNTFSLPNAEKIVLNMLFDLGLVMPAPQNVLIPSLFLSLRLGYKKIILLGADHSWHETITLDDANRVCVKDRHFYNRDAELVPFTSDGTDEGKVLTMDILFYALAKKFEGYWKIEGYAKHLGAQIYNASSITYIDAFKRKPLADILVEMDAKEPAQES